MNNLKLINQAKAISFCVITVFVVFAVPSAQAMTNEQTTTATKDGINVSTIYIRGSDGAVIKRLFSRDGSVIINHTAGLTSGSLTMCKGDKNSFGYSPTFTFSAGGGSWDTPHGLWVGNINQKRTGEKETSTYWQRFYDDGGGGRWGRIAWSAVKPQVWDGTGYGSSKVYLSSSNNNVVSCIGMKCTAKGDGKAVITANFPSVVARMWTWAHFSKPYKGTKLSNGKVWPYNGSNDWISEHWERPGAVNDIKPNWMFCPTVEWPSNDNTNYCANRLTLPAETVSWDVTVGVAARCNFCGDGKITSPEKCDTTAGSSPVDTCTAGYDELCNYCVSPGNTGECTLVPKRGPYCGDNIVQLANGEDCDAGSNNGVLCGAGYDETCTYCNNQCKNAEEVGPHCGDNVKNGNEICDNNDGVDSSKGEKCSEDCTTIEHFALCGAADGVDTNTEPNNKLCIVSNTASEVFLQGIGDGSGWWKWRCTQSATPVIGTNPVDCSAKSCLADMPIDYTNPVIISDNMTSHVSVSCPGTGGDICCTIENTAKEADPKEVLCTTGNSSQEIKIIEGEINKIDTQCWLDNGNKTKDNDEVSVNKDFTVQTACIEAQCTSGGTCAKTPKLAPTRVECKSSCNSNADCSSGRLIETKP